MDMRPEPTFGLRSNLATHRFLLSFYCSPTSKKWAQLNENLWRGPWHRKKGQRNQDCMTVFGARARLLQGHLLVHWILPWRWYISLSGDPQSILASDTKGHHSLESKSLGCPKLEGFWVCFSWTLGSLTFFKLQMYKVTAMDGEVSPYSLAVIPVFGSTALTCDTTFNICSNDTLGLRLPALMGRWQPSSPVCFF